MSNVKSSKAKEWTAEVQERDFVVTPHIHVFQLPKGNLSGITYQETLKASYNPGYVIYTAQ